MEGTKKINILAGKSHKNLFKYLREHSEGIFEIPKRDKKKDLFVQRFKGNK